MYCNFHIEGCNLKIPEITFFVGFATIDWSELSFCLSKYQFMLDLG